MLNENNFRANAFFIFVCFQNSFCNAVDVYQFYALSMWINGTIQNIVKKETS